MLRLFLILGFLSFSLFACSGNFSTCKKKVKDSKAILNQHIQIPLQKNQTLIFSKKTPNAKVLKYDPFLSLYLVKSTKRFKYPFKINKKLSLPYAAVNEKMAIKGRIVKKQIGLNSLATYSEVLFAPSILMDTCCYLDGLVTPRGIIQRDYIKRFIYKKDITYADIGIRVDDVNKKIVIIKSNPFLQNNPFKQGDVVLKFDGKKVYSSSSLMKKILFSKVGKTYDIEVLRDSTKLKYQVKTFKRYGGGYISDTFLEQKGIYFDDDLKIISIDKKQNVYGLKVGDKLIQVNKKRVKSPSDVLENISNFKDKASLLFYRNGFEFFVNIK